MAEQQTVAGRRTSLVLSKTFAINLGIMVLMILSVVVSWRLFSQNHFHNFICLFYP